MAGFSRRAELWMHQAWMFTVAVRAAMLLSAALALAIAAYFCQAACAVGLRQAPLMTNAKMELYADGRWRAPDMEHVSPT